MKRGGAAPGLPAQRPQQHGAGGFYLGWERTRKGQNQKPPRTAFTPPVTLVLQLQAALELIEQETLPAVFERHRVLGRACRAAVKALGMRLLGHENPEANVVTAFWVPEWVEGKAIPTGIRDRFGIQVAGVVDKEISELNSRVLFGLQHTHDCAVGSRQHIGLARLVAATEEGTYCVVIAAVSILITEPCDGGSEAADGRSGVCADRRASPARNEMHAARYRTREAVERGADDQVVVAIAVDITGPSKVVAKATAMDRP